MKTSNVVFAFSDDYSDWFPSGLDRFSEPFLRIGRWIDTGAAEDMPWCADRFRDSRIALQLALSGF